jgi:hypothetical protein
MQNKQASTAIEYSFYWLWITIEQKMLSLNWKNATKLQGLK